MSKAVLLIFLIFLGSSCFNKGDCLITASELTRIDLYQKTDKQPKTILFSSIKVTGYGTTLRQDSVNSPTLLLPVNPKGDTTRFTFYYNEKSDFITVTYSSTTRIIAPDCGAFTYFSNLGILNTSFDRSLIKLVNTRLLRDPVNKKNATNLQLFF
jgi:hypothetical protein